MKPGSTANTPSDTRKRITGSRSALSSSSRAWTAYSLRVLTYGTPSFSKLCSSSP